MHLLAKDVEELVRMARKHHRCEIEVKTAVLQAWAVLEGRARWTAAMVTAVEEELAR